MRSAGKFGGALLLAATALLAVTSSGMVFAAASDDATRLLKQADDLKTANNSAFLEILHGLEDQSRSLSPIQLSYLHYLRAWQLGYSGDYQAAVPALRAVIEEAGDVTIRFRAQVTLINDQALASHYEEAYARLNDLLELQPQVPDRAARNLGYAVASLLYNQAGQFDLGLTYAERWLADESDGTSACKAMYLKLDSQFKSGKLNADDPNVTSGIDACARINEPVYANLIRTFVANILINQGHAAEALKLLKDNDADVQKTHSARLASEFHSILARCHLIVGDTVQARKYALSAVEKSIQNEISKPLVDAYLVLYEAAMKDGDVQNALAYHEKYAIADKGYLTDTTARALAYQMVNQQVLDKKRQIDALNDQNKVLQLQQQVAQKSEEAERLYIVLLGGAFGCLVLWAWRVKQSQLRFQKLARRDGLTGILNRQHFMDDAKAAVAYCSRSRREACLILIDLDHFKDVNDSHGHVIGDGVLKRTVAICQLYMRSMDTYGRLGGEEFGVLLPDCAVEVAAQRAEELRNAIGSFVIGEKDRDSDVSVTASFGVTSTRLSGYDLRQMLIQADTALYRAKREGRNRVETFVMKPDDTPGTQLAGPGVIALDTKG